MTDTSLDKFIRNIQLYWNGLTTQTVEHTRRLLMELAHASQDEPWLADLHKRRPMTQELYRDPEHGFILLGHTEPKGLYRPPHDHGEGWVFYTVQYGQMRTATYRAMTTQKGQLNLVSRGAVTLNSGDCSVFLPRDIHDTECMSDYMVQFRLTSSDFAFEKSEGRMIQYGRHNKDG